MGNETVWDSWEGEGTETETETETVWDSWEGEGTETVDVILGAVDCCCPCLESIIRH